MVFSMEGLIVIVLHQILNVDIIKHLNMLHLPFR